MNRLEKTTTAKQVDHMGKQTASATLAAGTRYRIHTGVRDPQGNKWLRIKVGDHMYDIQRGGGQ